MKFLKIMLPDCSDRTPSYRFLYMVKLEKREGMDGF